MNYLKNATRNLNSLLVQAAQPDHAAVEIVLERISNSILPDVRRSALQELKDLAEARYENRDIGDKGLKILTDALKRSRDDPETILGALESLKLVLDWRSAEAIGTRNSNIFAKEKGNVALLLDLLQEKEYETRLAVVHILLRLVEKIPDQIQQGIISSPMGVPRLMDMLSDRIEYIRTESLLLLVALTSSNSEIQKLVAFEGAFDRIFETIHEEGYTDGGVIVFDCLRLICNLLRNNSSNQVFFRETGCITRLPPLLQVPTSWLSSLSEQKADNLATALSLVNLLVQPVQNRSSGHPAPKEGAFDTNVAANQNLLHKYSVLDSVSVIALAPAASPRLKSKLRVQALRTLVNMVRTNFTLQNAVMSSSVPSDGGRGLPCSSQLVYLALSGKTESERTAAEYAFRAVVYGNKDLQVALLTTITPAAESSEMGASGSGFGQGESVGRMVVSALFGQPLSSRAPSESTSSPSPPNSIAAASAARLLSYLLWQNPACAERLLKLPTEMTKSGLGGEPFLVRTVKLLAQSARNSDTRRVLSLLRLLAVWLSGSSAAVRTFTTSPAAIPLLVDLISSGGLLSAKSITPPSSLNGHSEPSSDPYPSTQAPLAPGSSNGRSTPIIEPSDGVSAATVAPQLAGLAALVLAVCAIDHPHDAGANVALDLVGGKIGSERFTDALEALHRTELLQPPIVPADGKPEDSYALAMDLYDPSFGTFITTTTEKVQREMVLQYAGTNASRGQSRHMTSPTSHSAGPTALPNGVGPSDSAQSPQGDSILSHYKELIRRQDMELEQLRKKTGELGELLAREKQQHQNELAISRQMSIQTGPSQVELETVRIELMRTQQAFSEQTIQSQHLRKALQTSEEQVRGLEAQLEHYEQELQGLTALHHALEEDNNRKEALIAQLQEQLNNAGSGGSQSDGQLQSRCSELESLVTELQEKIVSMESDQEELLCALAEQDAENARLKERLGISEEEPQQGEQSDAQDDSLT